MCLYVPKEQRTLTMLPFKQQIFQLYTKIFGTFIL